MLGADAIADFFHPAGDGVSPNLFLIWIQCSRPIDFVHSQEMGQKLDPVSFLEMEGDQIT